MRETYVVVGFRVDCSRAIFYGKSQDLAGCLENVKRAFQRGAQFISVRRVTEVRT